MLKPIPVEARSSENKQKLPSPKKQKFTIRAIASKSPDKSENGNHDDNFLKTVCVNFVSFLNRGTKYTIGHIDDLIISLQRTVLRLQKKKHQLLQEEQDKLKNSPPIRFKKKRL